MSDVQIAVIDQQDTQIVLAVPGVQGATGSSIPSGGTADQVLRKNSSTDYDANWTQVTSAMIANGTIVNEDINNSAAIAGTKISPDFGGQAVTTTGQINGARVNVTGNTVPSNGLYLPSANNVALSTNGTGRLFVDSSGNVGLGISSFTTHGATQQVTALGGSAASRLSFYNGSTLTGDIVSANFASIGLQLNVPNAYPIQFFTNNQERLRITSAGLVGVGTSAPGSVLDLGVGTTGRALSWHNTSTVSYGHIWNAQGSGAVVLAHALKGSTSVTDGFESSISISRARSALELKNGTINLYTDPASTVAYGTSFTPTPRLSIDSSGRVGIGTTSPGQQLTVETASGNCYIEAKRASQSTGQVAIALRGGTSGADCILYQDTNSNDLRFYVNGSDRAAIDSSGRLLVGTSSSSANTRLVVAGNSGSPTGPGNFGLLRGSANPGSGFGLGSLYFADSNGSLGADISAVCDGNWASGSYPTRLVFSVTADGASSPTEALRISSNRAITVSDGGNVVLGTTTGTKIGTSTSQKIGFFNETPIVQPTTGVAEAAFVENSGGTAVNVDSTFGGYTIQQVVQALQNLGLLA